MMTIKQKSFSRWLGTALGLTYIVTALWTVLVLSKVLPDIPIGLAGTILILYGINRTTKQKEIKTDET